jgi:hypothetical protein
MNPCNLEVMSMLVNGKKVTAALSDINIFSDSLPPEAARLLMNQLNMNAAENQPPAPSVEDVKIKIQQTMSPEADNDIVKREIEAYLKAQKEESLVKTVPQHVQRALEQREALEQSRNEKLKEFTIYESGVALGIVVGTTAKSEVINIMKYYSGITFDLSDSTPIHCYSDLCIHVYYDDNDIVQELKFVNDYKGMTSKGLRLGDTIDRAVEIYNQPKMKSPKGAVWDRFAVFCDNSIINSIRIQK